MNRVKAGPNVNMKSISPALKLKDPAKDREKKHLSKCVSFSVFCIVYLLSTLFAFYFPESSLYQTELKWDRLALECDVNPKGFTSCSFQKYATHFGQNRDVRWEKKTREEQTLLHFTRVRTPTPTDLVCRNVHLKSCADVNSHNH